MTGDRPPFLRVVRGDPAPDELAALVTVLAAKATAAGAAAEPTRRPAWGDPAVALGAPPRPGPDAWVRSTRVQASRTGLGW